MCKFIDVVDFYIGMINALKSRKIGLLSPLEEICLKAGKDSFAYIDNRRDAKEKYGYDFWGIIKNQFEEKKTIYRLD